MIRQTTNCPSHLVLISFSRGLQQCWGSGQNPVMGRVWVWHHRCGMQKRPHAIKKKKKIIIISSTNLHTYLASHGKRFSLATELNAETRTVCLTSNSNAENAPQTKLEKGKNTMRVMFCMPEWSKNLHNPHSSTWTCSIRAQQICLLVHWGSLLFKVMLVH